MNFSVIILTSVTAAKRAQKILEKNGISCYIIRTPSKISDSGCSNSLKIKKHLLNEALALMNKMDFKIRGVFDEMYNGYEYSYVKR